MKFQLILLIAATVAVANIACEEQQQQLDYVALTLNCLRQATAGGSNGELLAKVEHFSAWSEEEEIPCFTRCLLQGKGYFDVEQNKWHKQRIVDEVGADVYNYCRFELARDYTNACEFVHRGLRCLQQAEQSLNHTQAQLLACVAELNVPMVQLQQYADFKEPEQIPCLFQCFARRMHFYTPDFEWNLDNWIRAFGPMKHNRSAALACKASAQKIITLDQCTWMYQEYICLERLNYNTHGAESSLPLDTTISSLMSAEESVTATTTDSKLKEESVTTTTADPELNEESVLTESTVKSVQNEEDGTRESVTSA